MMRSLSPGYHAEAIDHGPDSTTLRCRDLRTRNFGGRFGQLDLVFDAEMKVTSEHLHV